MYQLRARLPPCRDGIPEWWLYSAVAGRAGAQIGGVVGFLLRSLKKLLFALLLVPPRPAPKNSAGWASQVEALVPAPHPRQHEPRDAGGVIFSLAFVTSGPTRPTGSCARA